MLSKAKKSGTEADWTAACNARNNLNRNIKNLKADFIKDNLETHQNEPKKVWKDIQLILPNNKNKANNLLLIHNDNNKPIYDNSVAANFMNDFFFNIGTKLSENYNEPWVQYGNENIFEIENITVYEEEVLKLCKEIDINK